MKENKRDKVVTVRLSEEELRKIEQMGFEMGMSSSEIIRMTVDNYYKIFEITH